VNYSFIPRHPSGLMLNNLSAPTPEEAWENLTNRLSVWATSEKRTKDELIERGFSVSF